MDTLPQASAAIHNLQDKRTASAPPSAWRLWFWSRARKIVVFVIGCTVLLLGVAMLVLPGPGWVTIFAGLAILATEFAWARWTLRVAKERASQLMEAAQRQFSNGK